MSPEDRFWSRTEVSSVDDCWKWMGGLDHYGYGVFYVGKTLNKAHRYAYELANGAIPDGLVIDHLCAVRNCVNPHHMEAVPQSVNVTRGNKRAASQRTTCRAGHPYNEQNTRITPSQRVCRVCKRISEGRTPYTPASA